MKTKIWIVASREFSTRVKKKSFIILTVLMPFLMAAVVFLPLILSQIKSGERESIAVVDNTGLYDGAFTSDEQFLFVPTEKMTSQMRSDSTDMAAVVLITADLSKQPKAVAIYSRDEVSEDLKEKVNEALTTAVRKQKLEDYNISNLEAIIADMETPIEADTIRWTDDGERESMSEILSGIGMLLTCLIYFFVLCYGSMVMQSVTEEKTGRVVELMVSSVKPFQLMMGKIIGVGLTGIFQMLIWGVMFAAIIAGAGIMAGIPIMTAGDASMLTGAAVDSNNLSLSILSVVSHLPIAEICTLFVLYFIGGYLLYASILAACGAAVNDMQDTQQFMMPIMVIMLFAFYVGFYSAMNPDGPMALWCSFIPFTSSVVMMIRIPFGVPVYQEILSIALLYATAIAFIAVSAKIYRIGILMYGKKPSLKEMLRWLKY